VQIAGPEALQHRAARPLRTAARQPQEGVHVHRQAGRGLEALRHITHRQPLAPLHPPRVGLHQPQQHAHQGGLARAVRTDQGDDPARREREIDPIEQAHAVALDGHALRPDQKTCFRHARLHRYDVAL